MARTREEETARKRAWRLANPEKMKAARATWAANNKERLLELRRAWRASNAKKCRDRVAAWRAANPEKDKAASEQWRNKNKDKLRASSRARYAASSARRAKTAAQSRAWKKANPAKRGASRKSYWDRKPGLRNAHRMKRIAAQTMRTPAWADHGKIRAVYELAAQLSKISGIKFHVDHRIPLMGKLVSGLHVHGNLQILSETENCAKWNKFDPCSFDPDEEQKSEASLDRAVRQSYYALSPEKRRILENR